MGHTLNEFEKIKTSIKNDIEALITLLESFESGDGIFSQKQNSKNSDNNQFAINILNNYINSLQTGVFKVLVLGEFSTGKSTFLNALLKEKILPVAVRPTTATINKIRYSETRKVILHYLGDIDQNGKEIKQGKINEILVSQLVDFTTALTEDSHNNAKQVKIAEILYPTQFCKNSVEILDTPGLASVNENHDKVTLDYLPNGNACIMILNPTQPLSKSERHYLRIIRQFINKVFFVVNKINLLDLEEQSEALGYIQKELSIELNTNEKIPLFPLNAKLASSGDWQESQFGKFVTVMEDFLTSGEKAREMVGIPAQYALDTISTKIKDCDLIIKSLQFSPQEFDKRITENLPKLERIRRRKTELISFINSRQERLLTRIDILLSDYYRKYSEDISTYIMSWEETVDELQSNLHEYLKESIMELNGIISKELKEEVDLITHEVWSKLKDLNDELSEFRGSMCGEVKLLTKINSKYGGVDEPIFQDLAIQFGGGFGIGWLAGMLLGGPLVWIAAFGGSLLFSKFFQNFRKDQLLEEIKNKVLNELNPKLQESIPEIKEMVKKTLTELREQTNSQLAASLQTVEDIINKIKLDRKLEEETLKKKTKELEFFKERFTELGSKIKKDILLIKE